MVEVIEKGHLEIVCPQCNSKLSVEPEDIKSLGPIGEVWFRGKVTCPLCKREIYIEKNSNKCV